MGGLTPGNTIATVHYTDVLPGSLNFVTVGTISFNFVTDGGRHEHRDCPLRVAQGHVDLYFQNNWWLGDAACELRQDEWFTVRYLYCPCGVAFLEPSVSDIIEVRLAPDKSNAVNRVASSSNPIETNALSFGGVLNVGWIEQYHNISDGQPWDSIGAYENKLVIEAARHKSDGPGVAFRKGLTPGNTIATVHYTDVLPGSLNFVTFGTISFNFVTDGGRREHRECPLRVAQGHVDLTLENNWWIGDAACELRQDAWFTVRYLYCPCGVAFLEPSFSDIIEVRLAPDKSNAVNR